MNIPAILALVGLIAVFSVRPASPDDRTWRQMRNHAQSAGVLRATTATVWVLLATTVLCLGDLVRIGAFLLAELAGVVTVIGVAVCAIGHQPKPLPLASVEPV
ncbi:hypothetical protein [Nonomuraea sp. NPDC050310]|uniref:hypothetical protein n=1 Tax=Nonomuraea sp. NPDC050310 TaxID=3154935 RepID=UPI0033D23A6C